jgi:phage tail protein X
VVTVRAGDTVAKLAADHYGKVDDGILLAIRKANPGIPNIDIVQVGQKVNLPPLDRMGQAALQVLYSVSVSSYHSMNEAKAVFSDLLARGYQTTIYPYLGDNNKTWYRITIGTFTSKQDAIDYTRKLRDSGFPYAKPVKISMED